MNRILCKSSQRGTRVRLGCCLLLAVSLLLSACGTTADASSEEQSGWRSEASSETQRSWQTGSESAGEEQSSWRSERSEASGDEDAEIDPALLQEILSAAYGPVPEYEYLGMAYLLDDEGDPRGVYIPLSEETEFSLQRVGAFNHGVAISVYMTREYADAADALSNLTFSIPLRGEMNDLQQHDLGGSTADNDTVGMRMFAATGRRSDGSDALAFQLNYADIKDSGYYMIALMTFYPEEYDGETAALITEINDSYAITLPTDADSLWRLVA